MTLHQNKFGLKHRRSGQLFLFACLMWTFTLVGSVLATQNGRFASLPPPTDSQTLSFLSAHDTAAPQPITNTIAVDPAPGQTWQPYTITISDTVPNRSQLPNRQQTAVPGELDYVELDTLIVIYPNTAAGYLSPAEVEVVKSQVERAATFYWRNSHMKLFLNLTYAVMNTYKDESEFYGYRNDCGWLWPPDDDDDGESVENDLLNLGFTQNQFDSINLLWAHNNGTIPACSGGLAWPSWTWNQLGRTGFTTNALFFWGDAIWNPFHHEFQHTIGAMLGYAGNDDYFFPDQPWNEPGRFGDNWDFHAVQMRAWPVDEWFDILNVWGNYRLTADVDEDGVPDDALFLPVTEISMGSSVLLPDTDTDGLPDLGEAMAGHFYAGDPTGSDSDGDGITDNVDETPIYPVSPRIMKKTHLLDGNPDGWDLYTDHITESNSDLSATVYANWDYASLNLMFVVDRFTEIEFYIDANADGWWHGYDNYHFVINPSYGTPYIVQEAEIWDCRDDVVAVNGHPMWDDDPDYPFDPLITESDIDRYVTSYGTGYLIQLAVPHNSETGLVMSVNKQIGFEFRYNNIEHDWTKQAWAFEPDAYVYPRLMSSTAGELAGVIRTGGYCDMPQEPVAGATVKYVSNVAPVLGDVDTDENGRYSFWIEDAEALNPFRVQVTHPDFEAQQVSDVILTAQETTNVDFNLRWLLPCMKIDPAQLQTVVTQGEITTQTVTISNSGAVTGTFTMIPTPAELPADNRFDAFGYLFTDSTEAYGPVYSWIEIVPPAGGSGTELTALTGVDDDYFWPLELPFDFPFYGTTYHQLALASNGTIYFEDDFMGLSNTSIPRSTDYDVHRFIAHFWNDLIIAPGAIYYQDIGTAFVIEMYQVKAFGALDHGSWQVILFPNGNILMQYQDVTFGDARDYGGWATIGIQSDPDMGVLYSYYQPSLQDEMAVCFAYPGESINCVETAVPWLHLTPTSGSVLVNTSQPVAVGFDARLTEVADIGEHNAVVWIVGNDLHSPLALPVSMVVVEKEYLLYLPLIMK